MKYKNQYYSIILSVTDGTCHVRLRTRLRHNESKERTKDQFIAIVHCLLIDWLIDYVSSGFHTKHIVLKYKWLMLVALQTINKHININY